MRKARTGEQRRDVGPVGVGSLGAVVREHKDLDTVANSPLSVLTKPLDRLLKARGSIFYVPEGGESLHLAAARAHGLHLLLIEHRALDPDGGGVFLVGLSYTCTR
jgi:hypothetical protein